MFVPGLQGDEGQVTFVRTVIYYSVIQLSTNGEALIKVLFQPLFQAWTSTTEPAQHLVTTGWHLDDLDRDISDLCLLYTSDAADE